MIMEHRLHLFELKRTPFVTARGPSRVSEMRMASCLTMLCWSTHTLCPGVASGRGPHALGTPRKPGCRWGNGAQPAPPKLRPFQSLTRSTRKHDSEFGNLGWVFKQTPGRPGLLLAAECVRSCKYMSVNLRGLEYRQRRGQGRFQPPSLSWLTAPPLCQMFPEEAAWWHHTSLPTRHAGMLP